MPGFIELQFNGAFGDDFTDDPATIWRVAGKLPRYGVTSFLPTIITSPLEKIAAGRQVVTGGQPRGRSAARGRSACTSEGPFLNPEKKGAHNPTYLRAARRRRRGRLVAGHRRPPGDAGARSCRARWT